MFTLNMITQILVTLSVLLFSISTFLFFRLRSVNKKLKDAELVVSKINELRTAQKDLEQILSTGISAFLHVSIKKSLEQLELLQKQLDDSEKLNTELAQWVTDFGKLTGNVYKQLKSIDERGMFEKDDDVGILFQDMVNIITEYNNRINNIQNDDANRTTDEKQG